MQRVPIDDASWTGLSWIEDDLLAVGYLRGIGRQRIGTLSLDGVFTPARLPNRPGCQGTSYGSPTSREGHLVAIAMCLRLEPDLFATYDLVETDLPSGVVESLLSQPVPFSLATVTFEPGGSRAAVTVGGSLCSTLAIAEAGHLELLSLVITDQDRSWNLEDGYPIPNAGHACTPFGQADWPTWAPGAMGFAFLASPGSIGVDGPARADAPWDLYLMEDPEAETYSVLLEDIDSARALAWSPAGDWLAFTGTLPDEGEGVWVVSPSSGQANRVFATNVEFLAWSPDGQSLALVNRTSFRGVGQAEILIADVSKLAG